VGYARDNTVFFHNTRQKRELVARGNHPKRNGCCGFLSGSIEKNRILLKNHHPAQPGESLAQAPINGHSVIAPTVFLVI
jgi:hypothetical protein